MVYCGKPSRGCQMCRTRRIKCDETKPTCQQCQKSRRLCPGYKDDFDLVFRNETQSTERRVRRTFNKTQRVNTQITQRTHSESDSESSSLGSSMDSIMDSEKSPLSASSASSVSVSNALTVPIDQQATNFFLSNFVLLPRQGTNRGSMDYLVPLIKSETPGSPLAIAFSAVTLAAMGNRPNAKSLLLPAMEKYSKAIRHVNDALRDPVTQKTDQTLAAVLMLGLFEAITSRRTAMAAWGSHIEGAVMIVKMRGKKQLRTKVGHALFIAVRAQMMINCMTSSKAPDLGIEWWLSDAIKDEVAHVVTDLNMRTTELRATVNRCMTQIPRTSENTSKVLDLIHQAQALDQAYLSWVASVPEAWQFRTAAWVDAPSGTGADISKADVYPGKVDSYSDLWIASIWNDSRVARLFLSGVIIRSAAWLCSPVDYRTTPEYAYAARLGVDMINDIVASIPFHMGWRPDDQEEPQKAVSTFACGDDNAECKGLGAYFCVWPLFSASSSDFATDGQRAWIKGRMRYIQETMGINQAGTLSHFQLRLPSMIVKRDALGLQAHNAAGQQAQNSAGLQSSRDAVPNGGYPTNPVQSSPAVLPPSVSNQSVLSAHHAKLQQQYQNGQKTAPHSMNGAMAAPEMVDVELQRAREEWEIRQREEWKKQSESWDKKNKEIVQRARGGLYGYEYGKGMMEKYFGLDTMEENDG